MKRSILILSILSVLLPFFAQAQNSKADAPKMSVDKFYLAANDNTANLSGTTVYDQNGTKCALIRIQTVEQDFAFDFGMMKPIKIEYKTGEVWVYVPYGVKKMTIRHPELGTLQYSIPIQIEKARTYMMELMTAQIRKIVIPTITSGFVIFNVEPAQSIVELDGKQLEMDSDGNASEYVEFGVHSYTIISKNYYPQSGQVTVSSSEEPTTVEIKLVENFGYLYLGRVGNLEGASIFVDDELMGIAPMTVGPIARGKHSIRISKPKYVVYTETIDMPDKGETIYPDITLLPNFASVTLNTENDVQIWINDIYKGDGSWTGELEKGVYKFETRKNGHQSGILTRKIDSTESLNLDLPAPVPVYGTLIVSTTPVYCDIYVDDVLVGQSPFQGKVLKGNHSVEVRKSGYKASVKQVTIPEYEDYKVSFTLGKADSYSSYGSGSYSSDGESSSNSSGSSSYGKKGSGLSSSGNKMDSSEKKTMDKLFAMQIGYTPSTITVKSNSGNKTETRLGGLNFGIDRGYHYPSGVTLDWGLDLDLLFDSSTSGSTNFSMVDIKIPVLAGYCIRLDKAGDITFALNTGFCFGSFIYGQEKNGSTEIDLLDQYINPLIFDWQLGAYFKLLFFKVGFNVETSIFNQAKSNISSDYNISMLRTNLVLGLEF